MKMTSSVKLMWIRMISKIWDQSQFKFYFKKSSSHQYLIKFAASIKRIKNVQKS